MRESAGLERFFFGPEDLVDLAVVPGCSTFKKARAREREREENLTVVASNLIISDGLQPNI